MSSRLGHFPSSQTTRLIVFEFGFFEFICRAEANDDDDDEVSKRRRLALTSKRSTVSMSYYFTLHGATEKYFHRMDIHIIIPSGMAGENMGTQSAAQ